MRAIFIDSKAQKVREIEIHPGPDGWYLADIYRHLECRTIDIVHVNGVDVYVDDEGLLGGGPGGFFALEGYPNPLAGHGLVLGADDNGDCCEPEATVEEIRERVMFFNCPDDAIAYSELHATAKAAMHDINRLFAGVRA